MPQNSKTMYIPTGLYMKLCGLQTKLEEILGKKPALYKVVELLYELQVKEEL